MFKRQLKHVICSIWLWATATEKKEITEISQRSYFKSAAYKAMRWYLIRKVFEIFIFESAYIPRLILKPLSD